MWVDLALADGAEEHDGVGRPTPRRSGCRSATRVRRIPCRCMPSGSVIAASTMTSCQPQNVKAASRARTAWCDRYAGRVVRRRCEQRAATEREDHRVGERAKPAEMQPFGNVQFWGHTSCAAAITPTSMPTMPHHRHDGELAHDFIVIGRAICIWITSVLKTPACVAPQQTSAANHSGENTPRPHTQFDANSILYCSRRAKEGEIGVSPKTNPKPSNERGAQSVRAGWKPMPARHPAVSACLSREAKKVRLHTPN